MQDIERNYIQFSAFHLQLPVLGLAVELDGMVAETDLSEVDLGQLRTELDAVAETNLSAVDLGQLRTKLVRVQNLCKFTIS